MTTTGALPRHRRGRPAGNGAAGRPARPASRRSRRTALAHPLSRRLLAARGRTEALETFPNAIRPERVALVAWALVRYEETPVGPYSELAATLIPDGGDGYGHIPFIVVDSLPSIVGGRANWLLPKALARFDWSDGGRAVAVSSDEPATPAWSVAVTFASTDEPAPVTVPSQVKQVSVDGVVRRFSGELSGSMRAGTVEVDAWADGPLAALIRPGSYDATGIIDCRFDVGPLDPA